MRIAITGATGFIGQRLVRRLIADGDEPAALTRRPEEARAVLPVRCAVAAWDPARGTVDAEALRGAGAVVHLAGESVAGGRWTAARKRAILDSRIAGTRALVVALRGLAAGERPAVLVAASAIGVYGDRGDEPLDEGSPRGGGFLADVCEAWEAETRPAADLGMRLATVRIGIVLGREGGALRAMLPPFRLGVAGRLGSGAQWMSWIHVDDLVELFTAALRNGAASGVLNGVAPRPVTNAEFTRILAGVLGRPALLPAPAAALRLALGEMAVILLASQRVASRAERDLGVGFRHAELAGALADLCRDDLERFDREQWVPRPPAEVFAFFSDPRNLERLTPPSLHFRVLRVSRPTLAAGASIDYRLRLHGLPLRWQSRIDEWRPPERFVDSQTRGPYATWRHAHEFEPHAGGTIVRDTVRYELPFGALGGIVAGGRVTRDLREIFAFRRRVIAKIFD
ncbi:MAG TPA: TIGR01777 family oxidoreductase [Candidatus Binatia bacterium]